MHNNTHFYSHSYYTDSNTEGDSDRFVSEDDGSEDGSTAGLDTARSELESARERHDDAGGALNRGLERLQISNPAGKRPNRRRAPTADASQPFETPREFSEDEVRDAFAAFDEDGDGFLDARDVGLFFEALGERLDESEVRALIAQVDADGDGRVSFSEFFDMANQSQLS